MPIARQEQKQQSRSRGFSIGSIDYLFTPAPRVELLGDDLLEGCVLLSVAYMGSSGSATLDLLCDVKLGDCPEPSLGDLYGVCGGEDASCSERLDIGEFPPTTEPFLVFHSLTRIQEIWNNASNLEWYSVAQFPDKEAVE
jgi:hypothetical protein